MKITVSLSALVAILGLALAGIPVTVQAQTTTPAPAADTATPPAKAKKPKQPNYRGVLTAIDTTGSTITVSTSKKDPTKVLMLKIDAKTKILKDKQPATLADFSVGEAVSGSYTKGADGKLTAASLHFKTPKVKTPPAPAAPAAAAPATPAAPAQ
jgi:hypothetical protein